MPDTIILFSDFEELKNEVEKMRTEVSMLLLERDELQFVICKNIETKYMLELGAIEYRAYQAQCKALRLKRKIELIQAKKNRQEKINLSVIEMVLDEEFAEYQKQLEEQMRKMNEAIKRSNAELLSEAETRELKKLYRKIVKALHPDIHPDATEAETELLEQAMTAYKNGDLDTLRVLAAMVGNDPLLEKQTDAMTQLMEEKKRLERTIKRIGESIAKIKSEFPYTMKEILDDPEKTENEKRMLEKIREQYQELILIYQEKIKEMLRA